MSNDTSHVMPFSHPEDLSDYVVIDLETTGVDPQTCKIIQLAAVRYIGHQESDSYKTYVNPGCPIPATVTELTGITGDMVAAAPTIDEVIDTFAEFVSASPYTAGWNVSFDASFLEAAEGIIRECFARCFDVMTLYGRVTGHPYSKLSDACDEIGYMARFHDALEDCRACGAILSWLCGKNRLDHALHSKGERNAALRSYLQRSASGTCPILVGDVYRGGELDGKAVVFTGALSFPRAAAKSLAEAAGATVKSAVSKKTDYLVVGEQDKIIVGCDGMSDKEEKAAALNAKGASIAVISEQEFLKLL